MLLRPQHQLSGFPISLPLDHMDLSLALLFLDSHLKPCFPLNTHVHKGRSDTLLGWGPRRQSSCVQALDPVISCFQDSSHRMMFEVDIKVFLSNNKILRAAFLFSGPTTAIEGPSGRLILLNAPLPYGEPPAVPNTSSTATAPFQMHKSLMGSCSTL